MEILSPMSTSSDHLVRIKCLQEPGECPSNSHRVSLTLHPMALFFHVAKHRHFHSRPSRLGIIQSYPAARVHTSATRRVPERPRGRHDCRNRRRGRVQCRGARHRTPVTCVTCSVRFLFITARRVQRQLMTGVRRLGSGSRVSHKAAAASLKAGSWLGARAGYVTSGTGLSRTESPPPLQRIERRG